MDHRFGIRGTILTLTLLALAGAACAAPPPAGAVGGAGVAFEEVPWLPAPGDVPLHADDGGSHRVPDPRGAFELSVVDAGSPLEIRDLRYDPRTRSVSLTLFNRGGEAITAYTLVGESFAADGSSAGEVAYTRDLVHSARPLAPGHRSSARGDDLIRPGDEVRETWRIAEERPRTVLRVAAVATDGGGSHGDPATLGEIFGERWLEANERARWQEEIGRWLAESGEAERVPAFLHQLRHQLGRVFELDPAADRAGVRRDLLGAVAPLIDAPPGEALESLRALGETLRRESAFLRRHVPPEHRSAGLERIYQEDGGVGGEPGPPPANEDCDCGGSVFDDVTRFQEQDCFGNDPNIPDFEYRVKEYWTIQCVGESGVTLVTKSLPELLAIGHCRHGFSVHPNITCPPILWTDVFVDTFNDDWVWERSWDNYIVEWGIGHASCKKSGKGKMTTRCPCSPPPSPWCETDPNTPILVDLGRGGFQLTGLAGGVEFDVDADGRPERCSWTAPGADDAWLALDRDGDGAITSGRELFGARTEQPPSATPNGYLALAVFDRPEEGGDGDGWITAGDAVWDDLRLWLDADRDGFSDFGELHPLAELGVAALDLDYWESRRRDRHGNEYKLLSHVQMHDGSRRRSTDVYLLMED